MRLIYEQLTYKIRGCIYDVHTELGPGYDEESYQLALEYQLRKRKISYESQIVKYVEDRGERIHKFVADLLLGKSLYSLLSIE